MRSWRTRYTIRCSSVRRRDQEPAATNLRGSGLPMPENGSRKMASTRSRARNATFRFVSTQKRRSSRNSGWNTATRWVRSRGGGSALLVKAELPPKACDRARAQSLFPGSDESPQETFRILGGSKKMGGFHEAVELLGGYQRHRLRPATPDDD